MLTGAGFMLFFGRLYTFFDIKWTYMSCIALFEVGSAVCGAAPSSVAFIIGRAISGLGSAGIFNGGMFETSPIARSQTNVQHRYHNPPAYCPVGQAATLPITLRCYLRYRLSAWSLARWCVHDRCNLEMVL